eukprot:365963-Chlamydomonas_euryale.AAC.4
MAEAKPVLRASPKHGAAAPTAGMRSKAAVEAQASDAGRRIEAADAVAESVQASRARSTPRRCAHRCYACVPSCIRAYMPLHVPAMRMHVPAMRLHGPAMRRRMPALCTHAASMREHAHASALAQSHACSLTRLNPVRRMAAIAMVMVMLSYPEQAGGD